MYEFSKRSLKRMEGVKPNLTSVAHSAIKKTVVDFGILEGLRTKEQHEKNVANGVSFATHSLHIEGDALDVFAWVDGRISWHILYYVQIAEAFRQAAIEKNTKIRWGGCWLMPLNEYSSAKEAYDDYIATRKSQGRVPFVDGVHFELWKGK